MQKPMLSRAALWALWGMETGLFLLLALMNLRYTAFFSFEGDWAKNEYVLYRQDTGWLFWAVFVCGVVLVYLTRGLWRRISPRVLRGIMAVGLALAGAWWMTHSGYAHRSDQHSLYCAAWNMLENNFFDMDPGEYLFYYPFQLGFAAFLEQLYRMFGGGNTWPLTLFNLMCVVGGALVLCRISRRLFGGRAGEDTARLQPGILLFCLPPLLFINYVYGNVGGAFFALLGMERLLAWKDTGRKAAFVQGALSLATGVLLKSFSLIFLIAGALFLLLEGLDRRSWKPAALVAGLCLVCLAANAGLNGVYSLRAERKLPEGVPKLLWIAMGMQESWAEHGAPGWYNMYNYATYRETGFDARESTALAMQSIRDRAAQFAADPPMAVTFYGKKAVSQWAEPTYQGFLISYDILNPDKYDARMQSIYKGRISEWLIRLMNGYQSAVWVLAAAGIWACRKNRSAAQLLPGLVILGGFLFSLLWEGKSQYVLPCFWLATLYAARGLGAVVGWMENREKNSL